VPQELSAERVPSKYRNSRRRGNGRRGTDSEEQVRQGLRLIMSSRFEEFLGVNYEDYDIHLNFPGGVPVDGPSAGIAIAAAVYSAIKNLPISSEIAMTGEISIRGKVRPVGGVVAKIEAAKNAGIKKVLIAKENWQDLFEDMDIEVCLWRIYLTL